MELVDGISLSAALDDLRGSRPSALRGRDLWARVSDAPELPELYEGSWTTVCVRIARAVAEALTHAHDRSVLHRDVKPSNVMLARDGRVFLVDFGLAQNEGDVYALGVVLHEALTLDRAFAGESSGTLRQSILTGRSARLRERNATVSWELDVVCRKAMDAEPEHRYASAAELGLDLGNVLEGRAIHAQPASLLRRAHRFVRRRPAVAVAISFAVLAVLVMPSILLVRGYFARARLEKEQKQTLAAKERADASLTEAINAVDGLLTDTARKIEWTPASLGVREGMLREAVRRYERILELTPGIPS